MTNKIKNIGIELLLGDESVRKLHDAMTSGSEGVPSVSRCLYHQLIALGESHGFLYAYTHVPAAFTEDSLQRLSPEHRRAVFDSYVQATLLGEHQDNAVGVAARKFNEHTRPVFRTLEEKQQFFRTFLMKMTDDGTTYDKLAYIFYDRPAWIDVVDRLVAKDSFSLKPEEQALDIFLNVAKGECLRDRDDYLATHLQARGLPVPQKRKEYRSEFSAGEHSYLVSEEASLVNVFNALLWREEKDWTEDPMVAGTINDDSSVSTIATRLTDLRYRMMTVHQRTSPHSTEFQGTVLLCEEYLQKRGPEKESVLFYVNEFGTLDQPEQLASLHSRLVASANELAQQRGYSRAVTDEDTFPLEDGRLIDRKDMNLGIVETKS